MKSKKIKYTILVSSSLLGGAILGGVVANNQAIVVHADDKAAATKTTSEVPADQKIKITDENTKISDNEVATSLGDKSKVNARTDYADDNGTVVTVSGKNSDTDYVTDLGPGTMFNGETKYYAEKQDDGTWSAKSVTLTSGQKTAGTKDFSVDVSSLVDGSQITIEQPLTDGVTAHISSMHHETADYPALIDGRAFFVYVYGNKTYDDISHVPVTDKDTIGTQFSDTFVNIPNTFHYYENGQLMTGILNLTYGKVTTTTPETTTPETTETTKPETTTPETTETTKPETTTPETTDTTEPETTETTTPETTATDDTDTKTDSKTPVLVPTESGNYVASGTGTPGNTILILDEDGNTIASGTVGADGKFSITIAGDKVDYSKDYYEKEVAAVNDNKGSEVTATPVNNSAAKAVKLTTSKDQTKLPQTNEAGVFSLLASVAGLLGLGWLFSSKKKLS
ncbi:Ig-like domain-containing protein [Paucilactobacillus sp. N302-9]